MTWDNETSWQHFLPQVEQRLNAINPKAELKNQRIYPFEIVNRQALELRLVNQKGQRISKALAYPDLFSFDVGLDERTRKNFENAFNRYERSVKTHTENLIQKLSTKQNGVEINEEVVNLFISKLLNFTRNPFSIHKVLSTFGIMTNSVPSDSEDLATFERVLNGRKPHQERLCQEFGITDAEYKMWLGMLFMLFRPSGDGELNMLESIVKSMFIHHDHEIMVLVSLYSEPSCLLSDRSFSTNIAKQGMVGFDFNLCSRGFIRYCFASIDAIELPLNVPPGAFENFKEFRRNMKLPRRIELKYCVDNMELLKGFNQNVVYQSYRHVYCASRPPFIF